MEFMIEVEKMKRYGFNDAEVMRATENLLSSYERAVEAAPTRKNADFVQPILRNFYDNKSYLTPDFEQMIGKQFCSYITADFLNQYVSQLIPAENMLILYNGPEKEGLVNPTEQQLLETLSQVADADIQPNEDNSVNEPLISDELVAGKVKKEKEGLHKSNVWTLGNGLKVIVLPTDYKKDQVLF